MDQVRVGVHQCSMMTFLFGLTVLSAPCVLTFAGSNLVKKVIKFLTDLKSKIKVERLEAGRVHKEFIVCCERFDICRGDGK